MSHLHLGILANWSVNTVRHQLKSKKINSCWTEIVRIANTQKVITTTATASTTWVSTRKCSEPNENLKTSHNASKDQLLTLQKKKIVVHKPPPKKLKPNKYGYSVYLAAMWVKNERHQEPKTAKKKLFCSLNII